MDDWAMGAMKARLEERALWVKRLREWRDEFSGWRKNDDHQGWWVADYLETHFPEIKDSPDAE